MKHMNPGSNPARAIICLLALLATGLAGAADRYQYRVLFNPGSEILQAEQRGRIMIYDGLENELVERALNEQFGRIENMMFVRTRLEQPDGSFEVENDGCD